MSQVSRIVIIAVIVLVCVKNCQVQFGVSSLAKHSDAYFSAVSGSMKEPIAALGPHKHQEC